jgi:hypothetical protein
MTFLKFLLMLIAGALAIIATVYVVNLFNHYEIPCFWPFVIGGVGGGAAALSARVLQKKTIGPVATAMLLLLLATLAIVTFKHFEYEAWRTQLIQSISRTNAQFASLPLIEKELILDKELETVTGRTGYLSYLMFPQYNFDLDIELIEDTGIEIPIHFRFKGTMAIVVRFLIAIFDTLFAYAATFEAWIELRPG